MRKAVLCEILERGNVEVFVDDADADASALALSGSPFAAAAEPTRRVCTRGSKRGN